MKYRSETYLWGPFVAASIATWIAYANAWGTNWYEHILVALGVLSLLLGIRIVARTGISLWPIVGVLLGLAIGQLWFLQYAYAWIIWRGFGA